MTDKERTKEFLDSLEIEYTDDLNKHREIKEGGSIKSMLTLRTGMKPLSGYSDSIAQFCFDDNDTFINIGVWEE